MESATIVIDGECGLCTRASHFGMRHGAPGKLRFVALQAEDGAALLQKHGLGQASAETMVAVVGARAYTHSAAVVEVAKRLRWPWRAQAAVWLVPKPIRDAAYRWVSARRRRLAGPAREFALRDQGPKT